MTGPQEGGERGVHRQALASPSPGTAAAVVDARFEAYLERVRALCRMPSVSATGDGIRETAGAVGALIEEAAGRAELVETPGHPVIVGEIPGPPGSPRLVRYGMYDVQPADELDWSAPPFAAEILDLPGIGAEFLRAFADQGT